MATYTRDEQKALDGLRRAIGAVVALNEWNEGEQAAIESFSAAIATFVTNRAIGRENEAVKPTEESFPTEGQDFIADPQESITPDGSEG